MTETKEYSSLPLVLAASGAILLCATAGWFLLRPQTPGVSTFASQDTTPPAGAAAEQSPVAAARIDVHDDVILPPMAFTTPERIDNPAPIDLDSELRKARLAASADMLVTPPEQNALYFYSRILDAVPEHTAANTEMNAVLARVALTVSDRLSLGELDDAYGIVTLVAGHSPDHALVNAMRKNLADRAARIVDAAIQHVEEGRDDDATAVLAELEALPGIDAEYVAAARDSITEAQQTRFDIERERTAAQELAAELSLVEWTGKVRGAIKSGRLVSPAGDSARDYLTERDEPKESKEVLTDELLAALMAEGKRNIDEGEVVEAEALIEAATELRADAAGLDEIRDALDQELIEAEGARVLGINNFVRLDTTPARYPRLANQLNITGWVDVEFTVTPTGSTADIAIVGTEPSNVFDDAAIEAVEQWTFQPREYRGRRISQRTSARLVFRLE